MFPYPACNGRRGDRPVAYVSLPAIPDPVEGRGEEGLLWE